MANLFTDMTKIRLHPNRIRIAEIAEPSVGDTVEDSNTVTKEGYVQYETPSTTVQTKTNSGICPTRITSRNIQ